MYAALRKAIPIVIAVMCLAVSAHAADQLASAPIDLNETQIRRFLNSYPPAHRMAREYWGERRFSSPKKMLDPQGTFERAFSEMRAAGKLPDFDRLLQAHGFEDRRTWLHFAYRISAAYVALRTEEQHPEVTARIRESLDVRSKNIAERRKNLANLPERLRMEELQLLDTSQARLDAEKRSMADAQLLRPFSAYFKEMDDYFLHNKQ